MPLPFNKALDLKLLNLVKENQALYNPTHAKYLDVDCREVTWQMIGDALNRPAMEFAAIQCQIHFGDFHEEKHKPGLIENLNEYLPEEYSSSWGAEKKILKLYRNHLGLSPLDAKLVYIKTARDLPTFGVTFFIVKEQQKGKKKMVPRLLGINSESILRLDENSKEILQTWPLTHVKTYHAGKNDTFTLNFGDYSDKPYSVKTNDALRIRDILEGYIDIIRKRLCGPTSGHYADSGAISQETVQSSRGNVMTHVVNTPSKVVEQSFVGPTRILPFEQGSQATQGTQVMTVQQVIVTNKGSTKQQVVSGEVPMRGDMSADLVKKLNRMNSNAVKLVTLLSEPTEKNIEEARNMIATMEKDLPIIQAGVKEAAGKQKSEEERKKLLSELDELTDILASASHQLKTGKMVPEEVQDSGRRIADLTTQMYFSLNPRRSELVRRSRQSFIADEKMEGTLRRASFIAAAAGASHAVDSAMDTVKSEYQGGSLSNQELDQLEAAAVDKLGKINAAVALFLTAHSDPNYIDYPAAVNSMNTIKELLPELATDAKAISHAKGGGVGQDITDEMKALCEATRRVCMLTGCDDHDKIQDAANSYADVSGRLLYTMGGRCPRVNADKENEIVELSRQVGDCATLLLVQANELTEAAEAEPGAQLVDSAGVACADAARDLLACAQLTAPTIHEAHCQSALTAAAEGLSSAARRLALAWKPLVEPPERHQIGDNLTHHTMELAKALDRLKDAYANLGDMPVEVEDHRVSPEQAQKLQFVTSVHAARDTLQAAQHDLNKPLPPSTLSEEKINELHDNITQKMAQTNACVASLLQAKSDPQHPDYSTAELAVSTITELTPEVVRDARGLISTCRDERGRQAMLNDIRAWCRGVEEVCASSASDDPQELEDAAKTFAQASRKLSFVFSPRARKAREQLMMELFSSAHEQAMQMVDDTNKMAASVGGASGDKLRGLSTAVGDSARALQNTLAVTATTMDSERCRSALQSRSEELASAASRLAREAEALQDDETGCRALASTVQAQRAHIQAHATALLDALAAIRSALDDPATHTVENQEETPAQRVQRLKFITSSSAVRDKAYAAEQILQQPVVSAKLDGQQAKELEEKRARELAAVNAAVALLMHAKSDRDNPDYEAADQAMETISEFMPRIINDTRSLSGACDDEAAREAMMRDIRSWCDAIQAVCASAEHDDLTELVDTAQQFADVSTKLNFVFNPRRLSAKEQLVVSQAGVACDVARQMASDAQHAARALPPAPAAQVRLRARNLAEGAQALHTTVQLAAPGMDSAYSRAAVLATSEAVGAHAEELVSHAVDHSDLRCRDLGARLAAQKEGLDKALHVIKDACSTGDAVESPAVKEQRAKFVTSLASAKDNMDAAEKLLNEPTLGPRLSEHQAKDVQERLAQEVARVNASVASLLQIKSDKDKPDYIVAEHSIDTISHLLPAIVKDTKALSSTCDDEAKRQAMLHDLRSWCDHIRAVCAGAGRDDDKELNEAAQKLASASNKMKFVVSHRSSPTKAHEVIQKAGSACDTAQRMATEAERVSSSLAGRAPAALAEQARRLHAAADKLRTTSQLTGPSIHEPASQTALAASASSLGLAAGTLVEEAKRCSDPGLKILGVELQKDQDKMAATLKEVKDICANRKMSTATLEAQQLKFVSSASVAEKRVKEAEKLIEEPVTGVKLSDQESKHVQDKLTKAMAQINAALASLITAKSDPQHPDYRRAEQSIETISELIPEVINDAKDLSSTCKDDSARLAMTQDIRAWCNAIRAVFVGAGHADNKELNESALQLHQASQKLRFVVSARKNQVKAQQILQLCKSASDKAHQMVVEARRAALEQPWPEVQVLLSRAHDVEEAAEHLQTTAQLAAASPEDGVCQAALLSVSERLSSAAKVVLQDGPRLLAEEGGRYRAVMERALAALRDTLTHGDTRGKRPPPPPVPVKRSSVSRDVPRSPRLRVVSHSDGRRASQDWLDHMRRDASIDLESTTQPGGLSKKDIAELTKSAEEERLKKERFTKIVEEAGKNVQEAERDLEKIYNSNTGGPKLDEDQMESIQKQMEHKLAMAGDAAAKLVASSHPDVIDYTTATQCTETLSELVTDIVKDAALLSQTRDARSKRALLDHIKALCEATRRLVGTAKNDTQKLNEAAVEFGDKSASLLYDVCSDVDPAQEKEVIVRARAAGDSAARLASRGAQLAASAPALARPLCDAGRLAADAARNLVYTAKLVAPWVHHQRCQNSLITASHELSSRVKEYSGTWKPLASDPQHGQAVAEMTREAQDLEKMLEGFRQELAAGKLVRRRQVEKIVVEDTGLRILAAQVLEMAQMRAESSVAPESSRQAYASYVRLLGAAIRGLDVANSRCRRQPHDLSKHQDLEGAVHTLQSTLLQARPCLDGRPQNNVIDLTEFVKDVSKEAEKLLTVANETKETQNKKEIETIKEECHKINVNAFRQLHPSDQDGEDCSVDGITEVDQFAQDCDKRIENIKPNIEAIKDKDAKDALQEQSLQLVEVCHFLSFATKSALAMAQSAALDETLDDLHHLEKRVDKLLQPAEGAKTSGKPSSEAGLYQSKARVVSAAAGLGRGTAPALPPALAAYVTELRPHVDLVDSQQRNKVKEHILRVLGTLKQLTATHVTRVATWQPAHDADIAALNDTLLQELDNPPTTAGDKPASKLLNESDINRLLMPAHVTIEGDAKQVEEKLQQSASKLVMLSGTMLTAPPGRAAPAAAAAALQMAAAARSLPHNRVQAKRTEEASQEMCMATYNLLKTAELAAAFPGNGAARGMMGAAVRNLRDAISKLTRTASVGDKLVAACGDLSRSLQASAPAPPAQAAGAPPYDHCVQLLATQRDVLQKLTNDEPMSREEFSKCLNYVTTAVCNSTESAAHCAYLISISEQHKDMAKEGLVDVPRLQKLTSGVQESCFRIMRSTDVELATEEESKVSELAKELNQALKEAGNRAKDSSVKRELTEGGFKVDLAAKALHAAVHDANVSMDKISDHALSLVDSAGALNRVLERPSLTPVVGDVSPQTKALADHVMENSKKLISKTQTLIKEVKAADEDEDPMTWVTYNTARRSVLDAFDALLEGVKQSGERAGLVEVAKEEEEPEAPKKSFVEMQEDIARKWLQRRPSSGDVQAAGEQAASTIIDIVHDMAEDISGQEKDDMENLVSESRTLLAECSKKYDNDNATALMELLRVARRLVQRGCVTRVVDDLLHDQPLQDLDIFLDAETDEAKRKFLLEKKIAELMSQLGRSTRTARLVARAGGPAPQLEQCCQKTELLAPQLVKAAQARLATPDDKAVVEKYKALLAEYTQALSQVRETCDRAVDPLDFVQTAGETMARMREESSHHNDPMICAYTSNAITRLAGRVISVSMSAQCARADPELRAALAEAQDKLAAAAPANVRASRLPHWQDTTAEILRTTGEVESALGGENIFKKLPEPDQPIYNAALSLHSAVRGWSARDNEMVAVAKRMAVLMARLSHQMTTDRKRELIATSKSIVTESREVTALAKKLAQECTDVRIRTNLLQVCERIPTISGQLKMLTTVKGSSLGNQGGEEDREAMNMLVTNAQNLMSSVQEVVKAAASASVKIASQRGLKWVRKNY